MQFHVVYVMNEMSAKHFHLVRHIKQEKTL